ncbi:MAG TPA: hypothetical protein PKK95_06065 [Vicinamibacterales bacterium]|nr:hypothetical protein [Acidobacteriota bacterium]HOC17810.1 hypothetical protein [Vicinamibacterales bacterium]
MRGLILGKRALFGAVVLAVCLGITGVASAQESVTTADIQRLQDDVYDAGSDLSRLRSRDAALADRLQDDLDLLREEVIYLKVKLRREGGVSRSEYSELRDRIGSLRQRARGESSGAPAETARQTPIPAPAPAPPAEASEPVRQGTITRPNEVPVGTELDVRLQHRLSSDDAKVEDRFEATTMVDLVEGGKVLIPAGSLVRGVVSGVEKAGRLNRTGRLTLSFDQITVGGRSYPIHATVTQAIESEGIRGEAGRIGAGAGVGAVIGGILGGFKGVLAGILIGGGGTIAATEGKDVTLPAGTVLRLRFDSPLTVR